LLKFESDLVCSPCHHGKIITASHSPVNTVMTEQPRQLLHMDTVGPSQDEVLEHFWSLALRLNNEHPNCLNTIHSDNGTEFRNASFDQFCLEHGVDRQFFVPRVS
jgi:hypothetical protein